MAYVSVPKDLTKVKNKVAFNLTKRQLICIGIGAAMGIPSYFLLRNVMGNSNAATVMVLLMLPAFLFAMYEKDGMHLEDVLMHMIRVKFLRPLIGKNKDCVGSIGGIICGVQLIPLIGSILPTEIALKKNFDKNGTRR